MTLVKHPTQTKHLTDPDRPGLAIVYDGECPFCSAFVRLTRLRAEAGPVLLVDARADPAMARDFAAQGYDLDRGMVVIRQGQIFYGDAAVVLLAALSGETGRFNRLVRLLFRSSRRAGVIYPWLAAGRRLTLRLLGRRTLAAGPSKEPRSREFS